MLCIEWSEMGEHCVKCQLILWALHVYTEEMLSGPINTYTKSQAQPNPHKMNFLISLCLWTMRKLPGGY